jgi:hypothetical protein
MKRVILLFMLLINSVSFSQVEVEIEAYFKGDKVDPKFQGGGFENFVKYINEKFDYSKVTKSGKMLSAFTIDQNGNVKNIKVIEFFDEESAIELIKVLKECPKWEPAKRNGKAISVDINYPMVFDVQYNKMDSIVEKKVTLSMSYESVEIDRIYKTSEIDVNPEYPGGNEELSNFLISNFTIPNDKKFKGGEIIVDFLIQKDGSMTDMKVSRHKGFKSGAEAVRVLQMCKKWKPAELSGEKVIVKTYCRLNFNLSKNN